MDKQIYSSESNSDKDRLKVHYRFGEAEFEAEGAVDEVNRHVLNFLSIVTNTGNQPERSYQLPTLDQADSKLLEANSDVSTQLHSTTDDPKWEGLLALYSRMTYNPEMKKHEATQAQQLLLITEYAQDYMKLPKVTLDDYRLAYEQLAAIPVKPPSNIPARLNELVEIGKLYKLEGGYRLTFQERKLLSGE